MGDQIENDDIYEGLEDNPQTKLKKASKKSVKSRRKSKETPRSPSLSEAALKANEVELIKDLIAIEENEKATIKDREAKLESLKKEIEQLKELRAADASKLNELSAENENLKKNICSLYKTAKSEIEHKDSLLTEANEKLDNFVLGKHVHTFDSDKLERCSNCSKKTSYSDRSTAKSQSDGRGIKRKYLDSSSGLKQSNPKNVSTKKTIPESKDIAANLHANRASNNSDNFTDVKNGQTHPETSVPSVLSSLEKSRGTNPKKTDNHKNVAEKTSLNPVNANNDQGKHLKKSTFPDKPIGSGEKCSKLVQTDETSFKGLSKLLASNAAGTSNNFSAPVAPSSSVLSLTDVCSQSRDTTETNNVFFSLLPNHLKQAFMDYEQSQIISLNRLKQSFVSQYFACDMSAPSPSSKCDQSLVTASFSQIMFNKEKQEASSVNTSSLLSPSTVHKNETDCHRDTETPSSKVSSRTDSRSYSRRARPRLRSDLPSLHSYQRDRRWASRRRYGHDKRSAVPKRIL